MSALVYFIVCFDCNAVKIGKTSSNADHRRAALQTGHPHELILYATLPGANEDEMHARFASAHLRGEWFSLTRELWDLIDGTAETEVDQAIDRLLLAYS